MNETTTQEKPSTEGTANIVYILYLVGLVTGGITNIIGVVMAYINQDDAPDWLKTHYQFQIRTFWIGILYTLIGIILLFVLVGYLVILFSLVWLIIRCVKGMKSLSQKQAHPNPTSWMF